MLSAESGVRHVRRGSFPLARYSGRGQCFAPVAVLIHRRLLGLLRVAVGPKVHPFRWRWTFGPTATRSSSIAAQDFGLLTRLSTQDSALSTFFRNPTSVPRPPPFGVYPSGVDMNRCAGCLIACVLAVVTSARADEA